MNSCHCERSAAISHGLVPDLKRLPRCARALKDGEGIPRKYSWGAMTEIQLISSLTVQR